MTVVEEPLRILIIDDEEEFATTLASRLELRDMQVTTAFSGSDGLARLRAQKVDVLLLDMRMPGLSGVDVLRAVREECPDLPVLIVSGQCSDQDFQTVEALGIQGYHPKPVDFPSLLQTVATLSRKP